MDYRATLTCVPCAACNIVCQGGDVIECAEPVTPDSTNMSNECDGGCNNTSGNNLTQTITCGQTVCGRVFTYTRPSGAQVRDTDAFTFTIAQPCTVRWTASGEVALQLFLLNSGCPWSTTYASATTSGPCASATAQAICLAAGTYTAWVGPTVFTGVPLSDYRATLTCSAPCAPCTFDQSLTAPGVTPTMSTCGAGDNCNLRVGEDIIVRVIIPTTGDYFFSLCDPTDNWDSYMYLTTTCCGGTIIGQDDDACPEFGVGLSRIPLAGCINLAAGTYYVAIEPFSSTGCGNVHLQVGVCAACNITCQPGDVAEVTEDFTDPNFYLADPDGGCNNTVPTYQDIVCGQTVCGVTQTYVSPNGDTRDTDWFRFTVAAPTTVTWRTSSEVAGYGFLIDITAGCGAYVIMAQGNNLAACDTANATAALNPGTYVAWWGPSVFTGIPAGTQYRGTLIGSCTCDPATQLTVLRTPGPANTVNVRWFASQTTGFYKLWSTTNKNNDGNPDNGTDPDFTLEVSMPAPGAPGYQLYVDPTALLPYVNYVVQHDCEPIGRCCYGANQCADNGQAACTGLGGSWTLGLTCANNPCPLVLQGDDVCGAGNPLLTNGQQVVGTNVGATTDGVWACAAGGADVWFRYTATATNTATVALCGSSYDSAVQVQGSCGGASIACDDDACGNLTSQTTFAATIGTTYWIAVGGFASSTGNYVLLVTQ
jgi:hypothetical protein